MLTDSVSDKGPLPGLQMEERKRTRGRGVGESEREREKVTKELSGLFIQGTIPITRRPTSGPYLILPPQAFPPDTISYWWVVLQHMKFGGSETLSSTPVLT